MFRIWNALDGNKTYIGMALSFASVCLSEVVVGIWGVHSPLLGNIIQTTDWVAMTLGGVGIAHKAVKAVFPKGA